MSSFDPELFMQETTEAANDTQILPVPVGEYNAQIDDIKIREVTGKDGNPRYPMDVSYEVLDDAVKAELGRDRVLIRQTIWLDFTSQGQLDTGKGKNVGLGKLRDAAGMNEAGKPFAIANLKGAIVRIVTAQSPDRNDPTIIRSEVKTVGKAA